MQTRPARSERPAVDLRRLVAGFLRMAPTSPSSTKSETKKHSPNFAVTLGPLPPELREPIDARVTTSGW